MIWMSIAMILFVAVVLGVTLWFAPAFSRADTPLGVVVPAARLEEPAVAAAIAAAFARFHRLLVLIMGSVIVVALLLALVVPVAITVIAAPAIAIAGVIALLLARRGLLEAKDSGGWMDGVSRVHRASVTPTRGPAPVLHLWPYVASVIAIGCAAGYGVSVYDRLPAQIPTHFGADGVANAYSDKGLWSVFGVLLVAAGLTLLMLVISFAVARNPGTLDDGQDPAGSQERAQHLAAINLRAVGWLAAAIGIGISLIQVVTLRQLDGGGVASIPGYLISVILVPVAAVVVHLVVATVRVRGTGRTVTPAAGASAGGSTAPRLTIPARDDDRYWKGGLLYVNRDDPAVFIPKRFGVGWTVNAGSRGGMLFFAVMALVVLASLFTPLLTRR